MTTEASVKHAGTALLSWMLLCVLLNISACSFLSHGRSVYDREEIRIGLETDPTIARSSQSVLNHHPMDITTKDVELLLRCIQVSGYSGTLVGLVTRPQPVPLFTSKELSTIAEHLAVAFREAKPDERVSFSLPKPDVAYSEDRTVGFLFFRGHYLHVIVTDHSSIIRTDTGGGETRDIRDSKGMTLSVTCSPHAGMVPDPEKPRWMPFERVHLSLNVDEVLAHKRRFPETSINQEQAIVPPILSPTTAGESQKGSPSSDDLQKQIQELSGTNQELRGRLDEQSGRMQQLQDQLEQLRRDLPASKPKSKSFKSTPRP